MPEQKNRPDNSENSRNVPGSVAEAGTGVGTGSTAEAGTGDVTGSSAGTITGSSAGSATGTGSGLRQKLEVPFKWFVILHLSLLLNSMAGVMSKFAGKQDFLSLKFFFFYGLVLLFTFLFALIWQQVLKNMSLTFAFTNKPITIIYALIWSVVIFGEHVTPRMVIGALVILTGIVIGVSGND